VRGHDPVDHNFQIFSARTKLVDEGRETLLLGVQVGLKLVELVRCGLYLDDRFLLGGLGHCEKPPLDGQLEPINVH
jgi:hypothetical protein